MSLGAHLARQQQRLDDLVALLLEERDALSRGQIDGARLNEIATGKRVLLVELDQLESLRRKAQHKLGYAEGRPGAEAAARAAGCLDEWQRLLDTTERARQLNEFNGQIIFQRLSQNQRTLNFLYDIAGKALYGPDGQSRARGLGGISSQA